MNGHPISSLLPIHIVGGVLALGAGYVATAVLIPIATMLYWLWRLRAPTTSRSIVPVSVPEAI